MTRRLLVANRGEIARRVMRTAHRLGIETAAIFPAVDAQLPYVTEATMACELPDPRSFLDPKVVVAAGVSMGCDAVHPGYGYLSEDPEFATLCEANGLTWVGPRPETIELLGDKAAARAHMQAAGIAVLEGSPGSIEGPEDAKRVAADIGYPLMVKAVSGGGGIGMSVANDIDELMTSIESASARGRQSFGDGRVLLERYVPRARHVEIQILGSEGEVIALTERDCSVQRRNQKVVEESPSPAVDDVIRGQLQDAAVAIGQSVGYRNAGTVEFLLDCDTQDFYFLEVNTRLQVEHPITEAVHGTDLVEWQFKVAGLAPTAGEIFKRSGHSIEMRVYAEDSQRFMPGPGTITRWVEPSGVGVRVDSGYVEGNVVTPFFDPLLAKIIVHGRDRSEAIRFAQSAVAEFEIEGPKHNLAFLSKLLRNPEFQSGNYDTGIVSRVQSTK